MNEPTDAPPITTSKSDYSAFLLRCWRTDGSWVFSLEDVSTRDRHVAVGEQDVMTLLLHQLNELATNEDGMLDSHQTS